ncbi:MAG: hypothetical protein FVQ79_02475 [Planctomycetes bacterium]|nr:hypothetical protein [Planctomycetota bacterium]
MHISSKRAEYVALTAAVLSIVFFVASLVIAGLSHAHAVSFLGWQILGGAIIWLVLTVVFHQRSLAEREKRDMSLAEKDRVSDTIFQSSSNRQAMFTTAQRQLEVMEKYFMPVFSVIIAAYHIVIGWLCLAKFTNPASVSDDLNNALLYSIFVALIAFISFLFSRYATGLSADEHYKPLRAGGSILLATSMLSLFVWISLAFGHFKFTIGLTILGYAIPILMIILGIETVLNLVMDVYRPRIKGQYSRAAFDSRLLGTINEPGGILHTFSSAIDYQFGFKVSQTWFFQLLGKAIIPLVMIGLLALYSLSCLIIVAPGEQAVIEHFGSFDRIAEPGLNCKLPWPFEKAYKHPTSLVQQIDIGFVESADEDDKGKPKSFVWGEKHYDEEYELLIAASSDTAYGEGEGGTVPVSLVIAAIPVQYIINDLEAFLYNNYDAKGMLEAICYRQITQYAASSTIETGGVSESILGAGRKQAAEELKAGIQKEADDFGLGMEIVFLGLQGVHPPVEVAKEYQDVTGAVQEKQAIIMAAEAGRNSILSMLAGSVEESNRLYDMVAGRDEASGDKLNEALKQASGDIAKRLSDASGYAFKKAALAKAAGERFQSQVKAFEASPKIYTQVLRLEMLEEALKDIRKYVVLVEGDDREVYIIDLQEQAASSLYDMQLETFGN